MLFSSLYLVGHSLANQPDKSLTCEWLAIEKSLENERTLDKPGFRPHVTRPKGWYKNRTQVQEPRTQTAEIIAVFIG